MAASGGRFPGVPGPGCGRHLPPLADITWTTLPGFKAIANEWEVVGVPAGEDLEFTYELTEADVEAIRTNQADWGESGMVNGMVIFGQQAVVKQVAIL